jgi:hypothetical protein
LSGTWIDAISRNQSSIMITVHSGALSLQSVPSVTWLRES